jgi:hypothetical protein
MLEPRCLPRAATRRRDPLLTRPAHLGPADERRATRGSRGSDRLAPVNGADATAETPYPRKRGKPAWHGRRSSQNRSGSHGTRSPVSRPRVSAAQLRLHRSCRRRCRFGGRASARAAGTTVRVGGSGDQVVESPAVCTRREVAAIEVGASRVDGHRGPRFGDRTLAGGTVAVVGRLAKDVHRGS